MSADSFGYEVNTRTICDSIREIINILIPIRPWNQFNGHHSYGFKETLEPNTEFSDSCCQIHDNDLPTDNEICRSSSVYTYGPSVSGFGLSVD